MIIEGLITTVGHDGRPHVAAMGPVVDEALKSWTLRPFQTSQTFANLRRTPDCVFHVVDDVFTLVQTVLGLPVAFDFREHETQVWLIESACHWYHLSVVDWDLTNLRSEARAEIKQAGLLRPFWGWNRAKHAILEAAILVTRLHIVERCVVESEFDRLENAVVKTAGDRELQAWQLLREHLRSA